MRSYYLYFYRFTLIVTDFILINAVLWLALRLVKADYSAMQHEHYVNRLLVYNLIWLGISGFFNLYGTATLRTIEELYRSSWRTSLTFLGTLLVYFYLVDDITSKKQLFILLFALLSISMLISRFAVTVFEILHRRHFRKVPVVGVLGFNPTGINLADYFERNEQDYEFKGILDEGTMLIEQDYELIQEHLLKGIDQAEALEITELYVSLPPMALPQARPLLAEADARCIHLKLVPDYSGTMASELNMRFVAGVPVFSMRREPLREMNARFKKRIFDVVFSSLVIVLILSWLYPIIALLIKWQSPGPVLFKQLRSGRNNQPFYCYKFRSMRVNKESDSKQATKNDNRITPIGRILRKTSLDELPQFFNVLKGDMSVVGPRPHMLAHTEQYRTIIDTFMVRHFIKPGITGWAQVNGLRGETREPRLMQKRVEKDIYYLENWDLMLDVRIIFLTIYLTIKGDKKAY